MSSPYDNRDWGADDVSWLSVIGRVLPFFLFALLVSGGLAAVYLFFSPADGQAEVVAAVRSAGLSAPFYKAVPPKPVLQRIAQSPPPVRIGVISGHHNYDSGAVCDDGLTEQEINYRIAAKVVEDLQAQGIRATLLEEFDDRLIGYSGTAVISIHADSCQFYSEDATGYKISGSQLTDSTLLQNCVNEAYSTATKLPYHANTITPDMDDYHAFREINLGTPAVIIEAGFMYMDRELLTTGYETPAQAITDGLMCYVNAVRGDVANGFGGAS
ncbi:MAG: N-acetylmuramoyl-L-alanine amidase [Candidatus Promineifilaceae bacterium]